MRYANNSRPFYPSSPPHSSPPNIDLVCGFIPIFPPLGRRSWFRSVRPSLYNTRGRSCRTYHNPKYLLYTPNPSHLSILPPLTSSRFLFFSPAPIKQHERGLQNSIDTQPPTPTHLNYALTIRTELRTAEWLLSNKQFTPSPPNDLTTPHCECLCRPLIYRKSRLFHPV